MISTAYIQFHLHYFFYPSELIDFRIGQQLSNSLSIHRCLDSLEHATITKMTLLESVLGLLGHVLTLQEGDEDEKISQLIERAERRGSEKTVVGVHEKRMERFLQCDGLKISLFALKNYLNIIKTANSQGGSALLDEMILKSLMNLFYIALFYLNHQAVAKSDQVLHSQLQNFLIETEADDFMINIVTLTLDAYYLPIKKLVMLYTRVLSILFGAPSFYSDQDLLHMWDANLLPEDFFKNFKSKHTPADLAKSRATCPVQDFYAKHNMGDCPLAQSIVVGLLRSLLTICNSQAHKKFQAVMNRGSGADSYREWQVSYQFIINNRQRFEKYLSESMRSQIQNYRVFNENSDPSSPCYYQFYSHKIYSTSAIANFFLLLLLSFKNNNLIQFSYLFQLISDANGILVFLKFLTDKFEGLLPHCDAKMLASPLMGTRQETPHLTLKLENEVMLSVYSVLSVLLGACNNYAEKIRSYLFEYNSYLIIKKIPHIFMHSKERDEELPSNEEMEKQFGSKKIEDPVTLKLRELTELCYDLLKIQIPFFSKKMKESSNNMRMIVDIYCQLPKKSEPIVRSEFDKILLKSKYKKVQAEKYIRSVEELKIAHNDFNNYYYWANEDNTQHNKEQSRQEEFVGPSREDMDKWLEENVWRYYD